ncbi:MAG: O-antigen ligase family protein [Candidatus Omnitrophica bacterium]|nr:O-antigen ligase family protein [Candidatus Omnitrophota bacterium]
MESFKIIMGGFLIGVWLFRRIKCKSGTIKSFKIKNPFDLWILTFLLWGIITSVSSSDVITSLCVLSRHGLYFLYFYMFIDFIENKEVLEKIVRIMIILGAFVAALGVMQYFLVQFRFFESMERFVIPAMERGFNPIVERGSFRMINYRSVGTFTHPNLFGNYLSLIIPLATWKLLSKNNRGKQLLLIFSLFVMVLGVIFSLSRGSMLSVLISFSVAIFVFKRKTIRWSFLLSIIAFVLVFNFFDLTKDLFRFDSGTGRGYIWAGAWQMIKERPFLGWGLGTFPMNFFSSHGFISVPSLNKLAGEMVYLGGGVSFDTLIMWLGAHNMFLNYSAEMGLIGGIMIYVFHYIYFKEVFNILKILPDKRLRYILYALAAAMLGSMIHGFFESIVMFGSMSVSPIFILLVSMTMVIKRIAITGNKNVG